MSNDNKYIGEFLLESGKGICLNNITHEEYLSHTDYVSASDIKDWAAQRFIPRSRTSSMSIGTLVHSLIESRLTGSAEPAVQGPFIDETGKVLRANSKAYKEMMAAMPEGTTVLNTSDWERYLAFKTCVDLGLESGVLQELGELYDRGLLRVENSLYFSPTDSKTSTATQLSAKKGGIWDTIASLGKKGLRARPDAFCVDPESKTIWVFDFKTTSKETIREIRKEGYVWNYDLSMQHYAFMVLLCGDTHMRWEDLQHYRINTTLIYIHANNFLGPLQLTETYENVGAFLIDVIQRERDSAYGRALEQIGDADKQDILKHLRLPETKHE